MARVAGSDRKHGSVVKGSRKAPMLDANQFLICGSGAGEGMPSPFCPCRVCAYARKHGGRNIRTRSGYQLGETIRFDWSPDAAAQAEKFSLDYSKLEHLFITHSHSDHFYPGDFWTRDPAVSQGEIPTLHLYSNKAVQDLLFQEIGEKNSCRIVFHLLRPFEPVKTNETTVTPLLADHVPMEQAFLFLVEHHGKRLLIGHDSRKYPNSTMAYLKGKYCDFLLPDATMGISRGQGGHMGLPDTIELFEQLSAMGSADDSTVVYPTHFSPNYGSLHLEFQKFLAPYSNFSPAYDGLILQL